MNLAQNYIEKQAWINVHIDIAKKGTLAHLEPVRG
jgi:hypothetical protein